MNGQTAGVSSRENPPGRRPPLVGRETVLGQLESAFEDASAGHGRLIVLVGEPGIGKTAVCEQLANFVAGRGGIPLFGHCHADGSAGVAHQPLVEV